MPVRVLPCRRWLAATRSRPTSPSSAPGAAGLYAALTRGRGRRARRARLRDAARRSRQLLGAGRPRRRARRRRLARAPPRGHADRRPRGRAASPRHGCSASDAPARVRDLAALGVRFDADRHGAPRARAGGRPHVRRVVHAGGSATGRRITRRCPRASPRTRAIDVLEGARAAALLARPRRALRRAGAADDGTAVAAAASCSPPAARPRCGRAPPTRPARSAAGCCSPSPRAPRWPTSS